jgi:hypothetical protein
MSRETDLEWAAKCERAGDLIDEGVDWLEALEGAFTTREVREVRSHLSYGFHADGGSKYEEPGVDGVLAGLREWAADLRAHVALGDRIAANRAAVQ